MAEQAWLCPQKRVCCLLQVNSGDEVGKCGPELHESHSVWICDCFQGKTYREFLVPLSTHSRRKLSKVNVRIAYDKQNEFIIEKNEKPRQHCSVVDIDL